MGDSMRCSCLLRRAIALGSDRWPGSLQSHQAPVAGRADPPYATHFDCSTQNSSTGNFTVDADVLCPVQKRKARIDSNILDAGEHLDAGEMTN